MTNFEVDMEKHTIYFFCISVCTLLLLGCIFGNYQYGVLYRETRTGLISTNIIGIVGEAAGEPYIEIIYSMADEENPGYNKTISIMVSPPYIFQNDKVYMTYEYRELGDRSGAREYVNWLLRNFEEGGAEYLRIINHSPDKQVEFFFADVNTEVLTNGSQEIPLIRHRNAPIYFLLYPERKPSHNVSFPNGSVIYFENDRIGDLTVTEAWSVKDIVSLYRAEYARSNEIMLTYVGFRIIDLVEGKVVGWEIHLGRILYGIIEPGKELRGNEKIWLLATPDMRSGELGGGWLR